MTSLRLICCALAVLVSGAASLPDAPLWTRDGRGLALMEPVGSAVHSMNLRGKAGEGPIRVISDSDGPVKQDSGCRSPITELFCDCRDKAPDEEWQCEQEAEGIFQQIVFIYVAAALVCCMFNKCCPGNIGKTHFFCCVPKWLPIGMSLGVLRLCSCVFCCCPRTPGEKEGEGSEESELVGQAKEQIAEKAGDAIGEQLGVEGLGDAFGGLAGGDAGGVLQGMGAMAEGAGMDGLGDALGNLGDMAGGAGDLVGGLTEGAGGLGDALGGLGDLAGGAGDLVGGLAEGAGGLGDALGGLAEGAGGLGDLAGGALEAVGGAEGVANLAGGLLGGGEGGDGGGDGEGGGLMGMLGGGD